MLKPRNEKKSAGLERSCRNNPDDPGIGPIFRCSTSELELLLAIGAFRTHWAYFGLSDRKLHEEHLRDSISRIALNIKTLGEQDKSFEALLNKCADAGCGESLRIISLSLHMTDGPALEDIRANIREVYELFSEIEAHLCVPCGITPQRIMIDGSELM